MYLFLLFQRVDALAHQVDRDLEHFRRRSHQFLLRHKDVPIVGLFAEGIGHAGGDAPGRVGGQPQVARDLVRCLEPDATDLASQAIGVLLHHVQCLVAECLVHFDRPRSAHAVALQKDHHFANLLLLLPGGLHACHALGADAQHVKEAPRFVLDHVQRVYAKPGHDPFGHLGTDPFDQARTQVFFDAFCRRGKHGTIVIDLELAAILGVTLPRPLQFERLAGVDVGQPADDSHQVQLPLDRQADDAVSGFGVGIGHALDHAAQHVSQADLLPQESTRCIGQL